MYLEHVGDPFGLDGLLYDGMEVISSLVSSANLWIGSAEETFWTPPAGLEVDTMYRFTINDPVSGKKYSTSYFQLIASAWTTTTTPGSILTSPTTTVLLLTESLESSEETTVEITKTVITTTLASSSATANHEAKSAGLGAGTIAGVVLGTIGLVLLSVIAILLCWKRGSRKENVEAKDQQRGEGHSMPRNCSAAEVSSRAISHELHGQSMMASMVPG